MDSTNQQLKQGVRDLFKQRLNDNQRFLIVCIVCGLLCGIAAVILHWTIHFLFDGLWEWAQSMPTIGFIAIMLSAPTIAGLLVGIFGNRYSPASIGSGIPQTKMAYYNNGGRIHGSDGIWRFLMTSIYCGLGNSLGREGPTVHISSAIASRIGKLAFQKAERIQAVTPVGVAAGIAAAFNAPLSAITFVFEELLDNFSMKSLGGIVVAVVTAAAVSRTLLGEDPILTSRLDLNYETASWMFVAIPIGLLCGLLGHFFVQSIIRLRLFFKNVNPKIRFLNPAFGGLSCGILGLIGFYLTGLMGDSQNSVFSIGYQSLECAFEAHLSFQIIAVLLVLKVIAVILNYATGGSGGLFSPTLFIGGMIGCLLGYFAVWLNTNFINLPDFPENSKVIGGCVLLGMGSMFAGVIRCPFTSLIIIFEMTGNYSLILPLMACNMLSWSLARKWNPIALYDSLLLQDKVSLKRFSSYQGAKDYRNLPVSTIMTHEPVTLEAERSIAAALKKIASIDYNFHGYPIIDPDGALAGLATHHEIEDADPELMLSTLTEEQNLITITPETSIRDAANLMIKHDIQQVPVVSPTDENKLLGFLTLNDITRQQNMMT